MFETPVVKFFPIRRKNISEKNSSVFSLGKIQTSYTGNSKVGDTENTSGVVPWTAVAGSEGNFLLEHSAWEVWGR